MKEIIFYIGGILGIVSSIITILQFFGYRQRKRKLKIALFLIVVLCTIILAGTWYHIDKENETIKIEKVKSDFIKRDAKIISSAIIITGWENAGDYIGHLTQIVGFYERYQDIYKTEYEMNKKQLEQFISFFNDKREKNEFIYSREWDGLKGLVTSGRKHLVKISNTNE